MSGVSSPKNEKMEEDEPLSKKRKTTNKTGSEEAESSEDSLLDTKRIDGGERILVDQMETSNERLQSDKSGEPSMESRQSPNTTVDKRYVYILPESDEVRGPRGRSIFESLQIRGINNYHRLPVELFEMSHQITECTSHHTEMALLNYIERSPDEKPLITYDQAQDLKDDIKKVEGSTISSEESNSCSSSRSQRRSQRAIKRKKFDDEVVSTEPGVVSATAAAVAGANISPSTPSTPIITNADENTSLSKEKNIEESDDVAHEDNTQEPSEIHHKNSTPPEKSELDIGTPEIISETDPHSNAEKSSPLVTEGSPATSTSTSVKPISTKTTFDHAAALRSIGKGVGKNLRSRTASMNLSDAEIAKLKKSKSAANKKLKKPNKRDAAFKDLGRWKPTDDIALITSVLQTNDLHEVHRGIKFSCHFTYNEVQTRWQALMYKSTISKLALQAIKNLHPEVILSIQRRALLSTQERELLGTIKSNTNPPPSLSDFAKLLSEHPAQFHHARTPRCLQHHWQGLKQYTLLPDQSVQPYVSRDNHILNFLDAEASIAESIDLGLNSGANNVMSVAATNVSGQLAPGGHDLALFNNKDDALLDLELAAADRKAIKEIRHLEADIQKWQILVDKVRGDNPPDFDNQTLAVLRGRLVRYLMRSKEITLGRTAKGQKVDVDLKLEGPAWKISRRQGVIKLKNSGEFYIANEGKRSIFVDGKPIRRGCRVRLNNNSVLEIAGLKFVFLINQDLIEAIRQEANKMYQNS